jgi:zinc finger CCCH domain-containing protein 13
VPGLRNAPPPRGRDLQGAYLNEQLQELQYGGGQRLPPLGARGLEHMIPGAGAGAGGLQPYNGGLGGGRGGLPVQQNQFVRGASPISAGMPVGPAGGQRLPAGLANLGSRPPHDPTQQFIGAGMGLPGQGYANQAPAAYGGGGAGAGMGYGGPQMRAAGGAGGPHQLPNGLGGLGMPNNLESLRASQQAQLLGLASGGVGMNNVRGGAGGFALQQQQQQQQNHLAAAQLGGRGGMQPGQHMPSPGMVGGMMQPPHVQSPAGASQSAHHDALVALLMGRRD